MNTNSMSAQHSPGPWKACEVSPFLGPSFKPYWQVMRDIGMSRSESMRDAAGKVARFDSEKAARAAITKATKEKA